MFLNCLGCKQITDRSSSQTQKQYPTVIEELCHQFSLAELKKSTSNFDENRVIGRGLFSQVYKGCLRHNGASDFTVAIKRFTERNQGWEAFKKEIELLCQLRHPNIVSLIGFCNHKDDKIGVFEYMSNGSLYDRLLQGGELSWKKRLEICIGAARGLHYLHTGAKRTIFHCILSPNTILLDANMKPKLAGFGVNVQGSRFMSKTKQINIERITGTLGYMAMEYAINGTVTDKCDVFSFGMILLEVVCGENYLEMPIEFMERPVEEKIDPNIQGKIAPQCWQVFIDIVQRCVKLEPDERPAMGEVEVELEHALSLQEQEDITNTNDEYTLLSKTIIDLRLEWEYFERALSLQQKEDISPETVT
ncbi:receptor-like protein kinase ANXUR2 [Cajanus cajan]|uniref:receptor-like protein kinase ANXUR2 n=1 Tax=Cajanus cajan TaxID=3821 RepID=UPI00098DD5E1|nr:receptor-like protein kinase ANXUR2 [Cajanus cajan]